MPPNSVEEAIELALRDGFGAALQIDSLNSAAHVGKAETHLLAARCALSLRSNDVAQAHLVTSLKSFKQALSQPCKLGSFSDRCAVRHNYACALTLSGRSDEAAAILRTLLTTGGGTLDEMKSDEDLAILWRTSGFTL